MFQTSSYQAIGEQKLTEVRGPDEINGESRVTSRARHRHRRTPPSDLAMYAAIVGREPELDFDPAELTDEHRSRSLAHPGHNWSVMTLCIHLKQFSTQALAEQIRRLRVVRANGVSAFARHWSERAINTYVEAQSRLNRGKPRH